MGNHGVKSRHGFKSGYGLRWPPSCILLTDPDGVQVQELTQAQMKGCLEALRATFEGAEVIYRRENRIVIRWRPAAGGAPIIIKMWSRPGLGGRLRRFLRITSGNYEWRALRRLRRVNMSVPLALGFCTVVPDIAGYTDALFTADLGECQSATCYLKRLIRFSHEDEVYRLENVLIQMTEQLLDAGMLDVDHGLVNTVVQPSGKPVRLDFELARLVIWPQLFTKMYGQMLGRLILLHAFAVQPDNRRTTRFAQRLRERLRPPRKVLERTSNYVREYTREQFKNTGIDTHVILPWH